jgi:hypothetical protein
VSTLLCLTFVATFQRPEYRWRQEWVATRQLLVAASAAPSLSDADIDPFAEMEDRILSMLLCHSPFRVLRSFKVVLRAVSCCAEASFGSAIWGAQLLAGQELIRPAIPPPAGDLIGIRAAAPAQRDRTPRLQVRSGEQFREIDDGTKGRNERGIGAEEQVQRG